MFAHDYNVSKVTLVNISHYPPKLKWLRGKIFNIHIAHSLWSEFTRNISISAAEGLRAKLLTCYCQQKFRHDDVIKWKHFPRYWAFVRGIHRSPVNTPHKGQCRGAVVLFFICAWIRGWVNTDAAGDLRRHRVHYVVIVTVWYIYIYIYMIWW